MLGAEKQRFLQRKDYWTSNPDCFVILKEKDLYQRLVNNISAGVFYFKQHWTDYSGSKLHVAA
jgi:hypothetical protein